MIGFNYIIVDPLFNNALELSSNWLRFHREPVSCREMFEKLLKNCLQNRVCGWISKQKSDICRRVGLATNHFQNWFKHFRTRNPKVFASEASMGRRRSSRFSKKKSHFTYFTSLTREVMECASTCFVFTILSRDSIEELPHFFERVSCSRKKK